LEGIEEIMKTSLEKFTEFLEKYQDKDGFIGVLVKLPNQEKPELIVNLPESLYIKIPYYKNAYNPDLTLKTNHEVRILSYSWTIDFEMLERLLEEEM
jgi:hypothetical protein